MTSRDAVARGARLLDREKPGWFEKIDTSRLDLSQPCLCVLGQLYGHYCDGLDLLGWDADAIGDEPIDHGFERPGGMDSLAAEKKAFAELKRAWLSEITQRWEQSTKELTVT